MMDTTSFRAEMVALLKTWADRLLTHQVPESFGPGLAGGLLCPVCSSIHGRSADAVYPLVFLADETGDERYLDAALRLRRWSAHMDSPDGAWVNDTDSLWKGITVFASLTLYETLDHHRKLIPETDQRAWEARLRKSAEYLLTMDYVSTNINYPITASAALAYAYRFFGDGRYREKSDALAAYGVSMIGEEGLLRGEGKPQDYRSPKGCSLVDLGYNVEESLPALLLYAELRDRKDIRDKAAESFRAHLFFMNGDGSWDNSWGTRNYKWTYWGSRTSDGCQSGLVRLAEKDEVFLEAARRNLRAYQTCTSNGYLYGGPHLQRHGELPCLHHAICHAKGLASAIDYLDTHGADSGPAARAGQPSTAADLSKGSPSAAAGAGSPLPIEAFSGIRHFKDLDTAVLRRDGWKATICAYDAVYRSRTAHCTGGSLSALYHDRIGSICTAGISDYVMWEPNNMQRHRDAALRPLTPRLEYEDEGKTYASHINPDCTLECSDGRIDARGMLVDAQGDQPAEPSPLAYAFGYSVEAGTFRIDISLADAQRLPRFVLPVWKHPGCAVESIDGATVCIRGPEHQLTISLEGSAQWLADPETIFNHVPGVEAFELVCRVLPGAQEAGKPTVSIRMAVESMIESARKDGRLLNPVPF